MLILASGSPRRAELLRNAGIAFTVAVADVDETALAGELPEACALRLARAKAAAVWVANPTAWVLGADTIVVVEAAGCAAQMLGKPADAADAIRMLKMLSGLAHRVITGVCVMGPGAGGEPVVETRVESTTVFMREIREAEIVAYVASGEPMDKAGAYAIQGGASRWVTRIEGCYFNVVGLPVAVVAGMLEMCGFVDK